MYPFYQPGSRSVSTDSNVPGANPDAKHRNGSGSCNSATRQIQTDCLKLAGKVVQHRKRGGGCTQLCSLLYTLRMTVSRYSAFLIAESVSFYHSWASASRPMPVLSVFWHPLSQYGIVAFRYRTEGTLISAFRYWTYIISTFYF